MYANEGGLRRGCEAKRTKTLEGAVHRWMQRTRLLRHGAKSKRGPPMHWTWLFRVGASRLPKSDQTEK